MSGMMSEKAGRSNQYDIFDPSSHHPAFFVTYRVALGWIILFSKTPVACCAGTPALIFANMILASDCLARAASLHNSGILICAFPFAVALQES